MLSKCNNTQCLGEDELVDIVLFRAPKSWQQEMDRQGLDPLTKTPAKVVEFMEWIKKSKDFQSNNKVAKIDNNKGSNNKKRTNGAPASK